MTTKVEASTFTPVPDSQALQLFLNGLLMKREKPRPSPNKKESEPEDILALVVYLLDR